MKAFHFLISLILLLVIPLFSLVADSVGTLELTKGIVKIRRNGVDTIYRDTGAKFPVHEGDEIQTGDSSRVIIRYDKKGTQTSLYSKTFFIIEEVGEQTDRFFLSIGKIYFLVPKLKILYQIKKERLRLRTATAIIGVKGTAGITGSQRGRTDHLTIFGKVTIASIEEPDLEIEVGENQASRVVEDEPPAPPVLVPPVLRDKVITSDTTAEFGEIRFETEEVPSGETKKDEPTPENAAVEDLAEEISEIEDELEEGLDQDKTIDFTIENP